MIHLKVLRINSNLHLSYLLLPQSLALLVLRGLLYDLLLLFRVGPNDHPQHPLDVWQTRVVKPSRLLPFLLQCSHKEVEGFDTVPVPPLPLWYRMGLTTLNPQVLRFSLYEVCKVVLADHGAEVGKIVDLLH